MARRLSRLPVAWSDAELSGQTAPNETEPNRTEPNKGCSSRHWGPAINLEILR